MIAKLSGTLDSVAADHLVLDAGGVGYLVFASARTLGQLPDPGRPVVLVIETHVREDHIHLYGFLETAERDWFRLLSSVQGVGARVALAILGALDPERLALAIAAGDRAALTRSDGVGPKLAGRIVQELRDKVDAIGLGHPLPAATGATTVGERSAAADAVSALVNLGYGRGDAVNAVSAVIRRLGPEAGPAALIPAALKELAP